MSRSAVNGFGVTFVLIFTLFLFFSPGAQAANKTTIEFWHAMRGEKKEAITSLVNKFMKENPDISVKEVAILSPDRRANGNDYTYLYKQMIQALAVKNQPDIAQVYENWTTQFVDINAITPVTHFNGTKYAMSEADQADFFPIFRNACTYNGEMWTVPFNKSIYIMYYNKDMFSRKNINPPQTWSQLRESAQTLTTRSGANTVYGLSFIPSVDILGHIIYSNGGVFINGDKSAFGNKLGLDAMKYWVSLANEDKSALSSSSAYEDFVKGKSAIYLDTTSRLGNLKVACPFNYGTAPLPIGKTKLYQTAGTNLAIFSKTEEKKLAAWRLVKFLTNRENTVTLAIATGYLPVRISAASSPVYKDFLKENSGYQVGIDELKYGVVQPRTAAWESIRGFVNDAMYDAVSKRSTSEEAMKKATTYSDGLLKGFK